MNRNFEPKLLLLNVFSALIGTLLDFHYCINKNICLYLYFVFLRDNLVFFLFFFLVFFLVFFLAFKTFTFFVFLEGSALHIPLLIFTFCLTS